MKTRKMSFVPSIAASAAFVADNNEEEGENYQNSRYTLILLAGMLSFIFIFGILAMTKSLTITPKMIAIMIGIILAVTVILKVKLLANRHTSVPEPVHIQSIHENHQDREITQYCDQCGMYIEAPRSLYCPNCGNKTN